MLRTKLRSNEKIEFDETKKNRKLKNVQISLVKITSCKCSYDRPGYKSHTPLI